MPGLMSEAELWATRADVARSFEDTATRIHYLETEDDLGQSEGATAGTIQVPGRINRTGKDALGRPFGVGTNLDRQFSAAWGADIMVGDTLIINGASYRVATVIDLGSNSIISQFSLTMISEAE